MTTALTQTLLTSDVGVGTWTLDSERTVVRITHKTFWGLATVKGVFTDVSGSGEISSAHGVTGTITVGAASIDTKNAKRDAHLRSSDFFHAELHPHFVVTVNSVESPDAYLHLHGELAIRGVREPVTLLAEVTDLDAGTVAVHISGTVDRHRFGVSGNQLGMIKGQTGLDIDAVFTRPVA